MTLNGAPRHSRQLGINSPCLSRQQAVSKVDFQAEEGVEEDRLHVQRLAEAAEVEVEEAA